MALGASDSVQVGDQEAEFDNLSLLETRAVGIVVF